MITFYDGASGRTRVTEHPATTTANHGLSRIEQIRERLAELTRGPHTHVFKQSRIESSGIDLRYFVFANWHTKNNRRFSTIM